MFTRAHVELAYSCCILFLDTGRVVTPWGSCQSLCCQGNTNSLNVSFLVTRVLSPQVRPGEKQTQCAADPLKAYPIFLPLERGEEATKAVAPQHMCGRAAPAAALQKSIPFKPLSSRASLPSKAALLASFDLFRGTGEATFLVASPLREYIYVRVRNQQHPRVRDWEPGGLSCPMPRSQARVQWR